MLSIFHLVGEKKLLFVLLSLTLIFSSFAFIGCFDSNEKKESDADCFVFDNGTITGLTNKGILQEKLVIPAQIMGQSVRSIDNYVFQNCNRLTSVTIHASVSSLGSSALSGCSTISNITVDGNNFNYSSLDGNLYNKNQTRIKQYAVAKTENIFTIPETVTSIGARAFEFSKNLDSIVIPSRIESIDYYAFNECNNLTIYCEATSKPSDWSTTWNLSNRPVYWYRVTEPTGLGNYWHYVGSAVTKW